MVGHLTGEYSRIAWYFLARGGSISVEASSHRRHCKQLCGRMEIPCWVTFTCSRKATLNWLKALLKVVIYANLQHGVQMFSQISRIPDLIRKFWAKKCGLYAGVYSLWIGWWLAISCLVIFLIWLWRSYWLFLFQIRCHQWQSGPKHEAVIFRRAAWFVLQSSLWLNQVNKALE